MEINTHVYPGFCPFDVWTHCSCLLVLRLNEMAQDLLADLTSGYVLFRSQSTVQWLKIKGQTIAHMHKRQRKESTKVKMKHPNKYAIESLATLSKWYTYELKPVCIRMPVRSIRFHFLYYKTACCNSITSCLVTLSQYFFFVNNVLDHHSILNAFIS